MQFYLPILILHISLCTSVDRVIKGLVVKNRNQFPFQVSIRFENQHFCGGVIYKKNRVLTAGHCIVHFSEYPRHEQESIVIVVGDLELNTPTPYTKVYNILSVRVHENFVESTLTNDIAVIKIQGSFEWNSNVKRLVIAHDDPPENSICTISGWGVTSKNVFAPTSNELLYGEVTILNKTSCKHFLKSVKILNYTGSICAEAIGLTEGPFSGDSGGPLICDNKLAGIISGVSKTSKFSVYASIVYYRAWIKGFQARSASLLRIPCFILLILCNMWLILIL